MIDHTRAFRTPADISADNLVKCDRKLLAGMRQLTKETLNRGLGDYVQSGDINALLKRRDKIVALFERKIATDGEDRVLFDMPSRDAI